MPLSYLTYDQLIEIGRNASKSNLIGVDPTIENSWSDSFIRSCAALANSNNLQIKDLERQLFPQTSTGEFLDLWLEYDGLTRNPATASTGFLVVTGTASTSIASGTQWSGSNGLIYESQSASQVITDILSVSSITRSGTLATATYTNEHGYASGLTVTFSGANEAEYNGDKIITVISPTEVTYEVLGSPSTPATGTLLSTVDIARVLVDCLTTGADSNLEGGSQFTIQSPISGIDNTATSDYFGMSGGVDLESDDDARARLLLSRSIRDGVFTADQVRLAALSVSGNTRVWVVEPEVPVLAGKPEPGQVFVYFLRDNDTSIIPSPTLISQTKQKIIDDGAKPAHTSEQDIVVSAPSAVTTNYTFSAISPDTTTMRTAISDQLSAFYRDTVDFETDITENSYLGAIQNTVDLSTGEKLVSFSLSSPTGDISVGTGEIGFLGTVTFP